MTARKLWTRDDQSILSKLRAADRAYEAARKAVASLPAETAARLLRHAKALRDSAYASAKYYEGGFRAIIDCVPTRIARKPIRKRR